jgi:hypothetical protein
MSEPGDLEEQDELMGPIQDYGGLLDDGMDIEGGAQSDAERAPEIKRDSPDSPSWQKRYDKTFSNNHEVHMVVAFIRLGSTFLKSLQNG